MYDLTLARNISFGSITDALVSEYVDAGITNVEISPGGLLPTFGDADLPEVVRRIGILRDHGVTVQSVHLPFGWDWDASAVTPGQHQYLLRRQLKIAEAFLPAKPFRFVLHPCYWPIPEEETAVRVAHIRENASTIAKVTGLPVAIEDLKIGRIGGSSDELLILAEGLDNVGFCVDMNHFMRERAEEAIPKLGKRILTVHISDYDFIDERHWLPGEGKNDWNAILAALRDVGYAGPFMYEVRPYYASKAVAENKKLLFERFNASGL